MAVGNWTNSWDDVASRLHIPVEGVEQSVFNGELCTYDGYTCDEWLADWLKEGQQRNNADNEARRLTAGLAHLYEAVIWPQQLQRLDYHLGDHRHAINALRDALKSARSRANEALAAELGPRQALGSSVLRLTKPYHRYRETDPQSVFRKEVRQLRDQKERDPRIRHIVAIWEMGQPELPTVDVSGRSLLQIWCTENGFTIAGDQCPLPRSWSDRCNTLRQYGGDWLEWDESNDRGDQSFFHGAYRNMLKYARQRWKAGAVFTLEDPELQRTIWGFDDPVEAAAVRDDLLRVWVRGCV